MAPVEFNSIRTIDPMVTLRAMGGSSRNLPTQVAAYDTVQQRTILPIQEIKEAERETRKKIMVRIPKRYGEE